LSRNIGIKVKYSLGNNKKSGLKIVMFHDSELPNTRVFKPIINRGGIRGLKNGRTAV